VSINRLVGERVFGWGIVAIEGELHWYTNRVTPLDQQYHATPLDSGPHFDREIAAAWEVQAMMKANGYKIHFEDFGNRYLANFAGACYEWRGNREHSNECMAICLAALAAMNVPDATIQEACK